MCLRVLKFTQRFIQSLPEFQPKFTQIWPKVYSSSVEVCRGEVRSITANWHLGPTSSLSHSTINYSLTLALAPKFSTINYSLTALALAPEWPWQATLSSIPHGGVPDTPMWRGQFWAETPVPNVLRAKLLFPFCLPVTIIFRFNIINVTCGQVIVHVQWGFNKGYFAFVHFHRQIK